MKRIDRRPPTNPDCEVCQEKIGQQEYKHCTDCPDGFAVHSSCVEQQLLQNNGLVVVCQACHRETVFRAPPVWSDHAKTAAFYTLLFVLAGTLPMALLRYSGAFDRISNAAIDRYHVAGSLILMLWCYMLFKTALCIVDCCLCCRQRRR